MVGAQIARLRITQTKKARYRGGIELFDIIERNAEIQRHLINSDKANSSIGVPVGTF